MGMAASQARYVEITARKTNVEYEGQQINQQRTALANVSSGLFAELMSLTVPTPPSTNDFTITQYEFNDGSNDCTIQNINNLTGDPDYNAIVTYSFFETVYQGIDRERSDLGVMGSGTTAEPYWLTNGTTTKKAKLSQCVDDPTDKDYETDYAALVQICKDNPDSELINDLGYDEITGELSNISGAYKYESVDGVTYYYSSTELADNTSTTGEAVFLNTYYAANLKNEITNVADAYLEVADSGRYNEITLEGYSQSFTLNAATSTDESAYNDAMNEYVYQQQMYEQEVNNINAKTEIIEEQDRTLEMKLKQLDTEQEALQTEMEAVKKVIDKNIEQTFKTFAS